MGKFHNRTEAGKMLAQSLITYANHKDLLVLALPRGGVPVAFEVAKTLNVPLDVCIVRKLGVPGNEELAMGAIASGDIGVLNYDVINTLGIGKETIQKVASEELQELKRRDRKYRGDAAPININNKTVILVDDGIATGSTIRAAITLIKKQKPLKLIVAIPIAPASTCEELKLEVDEIVSLESPELMSAIGLWYEDFSQTTDEEVSELLKQGKGNREQ
ncbi:MAG: phosphoribosyltransferase [Nostocales cyanobacterium]|nr:MAG: phosphoribosyltransferase [Nostocales cyanobacterium]TAF19682.1 MAG: phosphoribosyltransferase [Nostocales cyanobacterium]